MNRPSDRSCTACNDSPCWVRTDRSRAPSTRAKSDATSPTLPPGRAGPVLPVARVGPRPGGRVRCAATDIL
ncbi:hypothetical protein GCM10009657_35510 [Oryzihumus leptocrescens]